MANGSKDNLLVEFGVLVDEEDFGNRSEVLEYLKLRTNGVVLLCFWLFLARVVLKFMN